MKRLFALLLCCLLLTACGKQPEAPAQTDAPTVTAAPTEAPTAAPTQAPTEAPTEAPTAEPVALYETSYANAVCYRDAQGGIWAQTVIAVKNLSDEPLFLDISAAELQDAEGDPIAALHSVSAYPHVISTGETGYYYEATRLDLGEAEELTLLPDLNIRKATEDEIRLAAPLTIEETSLTDSVYGGLTLTGCVKDCDGLIGIAAVLFDENGTPLDLLYTVDNLSGDTEFELNSFMPSEELTSDRVADYRVFAYRYLYISVCH